VTLTIERRRSLEALGASTPVAAGNGFDNSSSVDRSLVKKTFSIPHGKRARGASG
jgi:hypothetical protein